MCLCVNSFVSGRCFVPAQCTVDASKQSKNLMEHVTACVELCFFTNKYRYSFNEKKQKATAALNRPYDDKSTTLLYFTYLVVTADTL